MWLLLWDPLTFAALTAIYIIGFIMLQYIATKVAPRVASKISSRLSLYTAMTLTAAAIVAGGLLAIYIIYSIAASYGVAFSVVWVLGIAVTLSLLSYILSPYMINVAYRARESPELQRVVDEVASRAGMKPPKAVLVEGPPNAFAYGNFLTGRYVAVSRSLYEMLPREELEAVIGHELGHHKHKDTIIIMLLGLIPSILYYMGFWLLRVGLWSGAYRGRDEEGNSGLVLAAIGAISVLLSFIMQVAVLAFSRLREYYADAHGAFVAGARNLQRALARLHLYYETRGKEIIEKSSLKALFIYALTEAIASPFYSPTGKEWMYVGDIDAVVERLKRQPVNPAEEFFSDHPPIPKRLRFLDRAASLSRV
jgi:heat shock protein HtpX